MTEAVCLHFFPPLRITAWTDGGRAAGRERGEGFPSSLFFLAHELGSGDRCCEMPVDEVDPGGAVGLSSVFPLFQASADFLFPSSLGAVGEVAVQHGRAAVLAESAIFFTRKFFFPSPLPSRIRASQAAPRRARNHDRSFPP